MPTYDLDEVEQAFRRYWKTTVDEDWDAWADMFTEDADYFDCYLGSLKGREAIREYIKPLMASFPEVYSTYEWHLCSPDGRCVVHMQNRRDSPEPGAPSIDCAGVTVLQYAGGSRTRRTIGTSRLGSQRPSSMSRRALPTTPITPRSGRVSTGALAPSGPTAHPATPNRPGSGNRSR